MFFQNNKKNEKGFGIMEAIVATGIFALVVTSLLASLINFNKWQVVSGEKTRAIFLTEECQEVVRNLRDADFANLTNGTYGLVKESNSWSLVSNLQQEDIYTRSVTISTADTNIKEINCQTLWNDNAGKQNTFSLVSLLSDWQREVLPDYSTCAEYCVFLGYSSSRCRNNQNRCAVYSEVSEPGGDELCELAGDRKACCCSGSLPEQDNVAPDIISDLLVGNVGNDFMVLGWTATGDDGFSGTASGYDLRYSTNFIDNNNWALAQQVIGEPMPSVSGSNENMTVAGLSPLTTYYFAIKVFDEVGNYSDLSNIATEITTGQIVTTCTEYCQSILYTDGICRGSKKECTNNGEIRERDGNQYCPGDKKHDNCCCF